MGIRLGPSLGRVPSSFGPTCCMLHASKVKGFLVCCAQGRQASRPASVMRPTFEAVGGFVDHDGLFAGRSGLGAKGQTAISSPCLRSGQPPTTPLSDLHGGGQGSDLDCTAGCDCLRTTGLLAPANEPRSTSRVPTGRGAARLQSDNTVVLCQTSQPRTHPGSPPITQHTMAIIQNLVGASTPAYETHIPGNMA